MSPVTSLPVMRNLLSLLALLLLAGSGALHADTPPAAQLYKEHCSVCHGPDRLGAIGPALLPENLGRLKPAQAQQVIREGRALTQMPPFGEKLDGASIESLAAFIYTPPEEAPRWGIEQIRTSHINSGAPSPLSKPVYEVKDPLNLFVVVETGDHHATILDGDTFTPIHRFRTRYALHGGPKFSPDGRFVFFMSRDGWVTKYDLWGLDTVAEVRAGINSRNIAVSADARYVMVANYLPHSLVVLSADDLSPVKVIAASGLDGKSSRVGAVYTAPPRGSFLAALKDARELWEIDYRDPGFPLKRVELPDFFDDFFFDQGYTVALGASRDGGKGHVVALDGGAQRATFDMPGLPHLASGITWTRDGHTVMASPNLKEGFVSVVDTRDWQLVKRIPTPGPGFFMRSHDKSPYAWVDSFFAKQKDAVTVLDKQSLEVVKQLRPAPGKTAAHVEFTRDGRYALLSIWDDDGAVVVYDAASLDEVKRIPMRKPSGKYNVWNKIHYAEGTSH